MKNIEEMTEKEILLETLNQQKKSAFYNKLSALTVVVLTAVICVTLAVMVPRAIHTMNNADKFITDYNKVVLQADETLDEIDAMVKNVNSLVEENTELVNESLKNVSEIDIDTLNDSIQRFSTVTETLSKVFGMFGGNK